MMLRATCKRCGAEGQIGRSIEHRFGCELCQAPTPPRETWPPPVEPQCPVVCPFRLTCATSTQIGIATLWREGRITQPAQCTFYERRARIHLATTGRTPPATADALLEQLRERTATQGEGA